jgi:hypothetical protein
MRAAQPCFDVNLPADASMKSTSFVITFAMFAPNNAS